MHSPGNISGHIVDIIGKRTFKGRITIAEGHIISISEADIVPDQYILPGFIDAHIHIESSMVTPMAFAEVAASHGTVATVSDPHEIANVCGTDGVQFMIDNSRNAVIKIFFGAPSCVPATTFENAGATLDSKEVDRLLASEDIWYLSEMMNYPGVLNNDPEVLAKIKCASYYGKPVDGHAPGLRGLQAKDYIDHGISTDHECTTLAEASDKLDHGMKIIIREGSAAKNFDALHPIISTHPDDVMFCSDDKHPDDLIVGHINLLVKKALQLGYDLYDVLKIACINPIFHYNIPVGHLREGDPADFIVVDTLVDFNIIKTFINGNEIIPGNDQYKNPKKTLINQFNINVQHADILKVKDIGLIEYPIIVAVDGSLVTEKLFASLPTESGYLLPDFSKGIIKIAVINRYHDAPAAVGFIQNFGLKGCAIASTVAHDSHNIIAVGDDDALIIKAVNLLIESKGGLSAVAKDSRIHIPLPIAGLMSDKPCHEIGHLYSEISSFVKAHGCTLHAPYMTLSFMALLVIPKIKISDLGMFDAEAFSFY
ncbi:MAG: adenine deaminase [Saprospiraceae bacterium]|nr:adenine deaminase [Saprospiraceae bacterium]